MKVLSLLRLAFPFLISSIAQPNAHAAVVYVDITAPPGGNGLSWPTAYNDLADALQASGGGEIWVAAGTYSTPGKPFLLPFWTGLYGGFSGNETSIADRDLNANPTRLDAQGSNRIIEFQDHSNGQYVVDGIHFVNGWAGATGGGAFQFYEGSPIIRNCVFSGCRSTGDGGAVNLYTGAPEFSDCRFESNAADGSGGAVAGYEANFLFDRCILSNNVSSAFGGGAHDYTGDSSFLSCLFHGNQSADGGSAIRTHGGHLRLLNTTITQNSTAGTGAVLDAVGNTILRNSIVHGNTAASIPAIAVVSQATLDVSHSCVEGGYPGIGNQSVVPAFVQDGSFTLAAPSSLIDAGSNSDVPAEASLDIHGNPRLVDVFSVVDTGVGVSPIVDIGAVETPCEAPSFAYGDGCPGSGGFTPVLGIEGCPAIGAPFSMFVTDGLGGSIALLFLGVAQAETPIQGSCKLLVSPVLPPFFALPLGGVGAGNGAALIPATVPASIPSGVTVTVQFMIADPGTSTGLSTTEGLSITFH